MAETIAQAVKQIKNTVFLTNLDESATKQSVVLRLLSLCGWDPFDLSQAAIPGIFSGSIAKATTVAMSWYLEPSAS